LIFVALGSHEIPFPRILIETEKVARRGMLKDEFVLQVGHTDFTSEYCRVVKFLENTEFSNTINESRIFITHGGVGSILTGLRSKKVVIAAPRTRRLKEHVDEHQFEIVERLSELGHILPYWPWSNLANTIALAEAFVPVEYVFDNSDLISSIRSHLRSS